jgi:DNA-binding CsgD family transcriptional regulator
MRKKLFDVDELLAIWDIKSIPKDGYFNKLHIESNPVLTEVFNMTRTVPIVVDVKRMSPKYVGVDLKSWWGWTLEGLFGEGVKSYMSFIHPEDLVIHEQVTHLLFGILESCSYEDKYQLRAMLNFRLRKSDGNYVQVLQVSRILELDPEGNIQTLLILLQEFNYVSDFPRRYVHFSGIPQQEKLYEYQVESRELRRLGLPTNREKEIISFLMIGEDSQQIADRLFISKHTIDTHRRRILQKFHLKNTQELSHLVTMTRLLDCY